MLKALCTVRHQITVAQKLGFMVQYVQLRPSTCCFKTILNRLCIKLSHLSLAGLICSLIVSGSVLYSQVLYCA